MTRVCSDRKVVCTAACRARWVPVFGVRFSPLPRNALPRNDGGHSSRVGCAVRAPTAPSAQGGVRVAGKTSDKRLSPERAPSPRRRGTRCRRKELDAHEWWPACAETRGQEQAPYRPVIRLRNSHDAYEGDTADGRSAHRPLQSRDRVPDRVFRGVYQHCAHRNRDQVGHQHRRARRRIVLMSRSGHERAVPGRLAEGEKCHQW